MDLSLSLCAPWGVILPETTLPFPPGTEDQGAQLPKDERVTEQQGFTEGFLEHYKPPFLA